MARPVVFIPGYPGSHVVEAATGKTVFLNIPGLLFPASRKRILRQLETPDDLSLPDPLRAGAPIRRLAQFLFFDLAKQADSLYDILGGIGIEPAKFGWDWRRPVWDPPMQVRLEQAIRHESALKGEPVTVIAHSTGGLALRCLLEARAGDAAFLSLIERIVAFGVPWAGTLKSFLFLAGRRAFGPFLSRAETRRLVSLTWAAFDLLPPDPDKTLLEDADGRPLRLVLDGAGRQASPLLKQGWFPQDLASRMALRADAADRELGARTPSLRLGGPTLPVTNVVGWGEETTVCAAITGSSSQQGVAFIQEKGDDLHSGGDGTIPRVSAAWLRGPGVTTWHLPVGVDHGGKMNPHSTLWRNPGGRNLLRHLLGGVPFDPFVYGAVDDEDAVRTGVANVRVRTTALDDSGRPLVDAAVRANDLLSGVTPWSSFPASGEGRHLIRIPRSHMRAYDPAYRRFTLEWRWREGGQTRTLERSYFVTK